jgi:exodeoxyribonuclease V beta subunit
MTRLDAPAVQFEPRRIDDWRELPLHAGGRSLVEASAGTGKTWTISVLYLRLLLEGDEPLGAARIAVTTFTDAAAQELRERLRRRLAWAEQLACRVLDDAWPGPDAARTDEAWLHARWSADGMYDAARVRTDLNRLRLALVELDLAPIGTLHGFCRRVLADFPFECGSAFVPGEMVCARALHAELVQDLWRELVQSDGALDPGAQAWVDEGRDALARALEAALAPGVVIRSLDALTVRDLLCAENAEQLRGFCDDASRFARSNAALIGILRRLADLLEAGAMDAPLPKDCARHLFDEVHKQFKPACLEEALAHPAMQLARHAVRVLPHALAPAKAEALQRFRDRIRARRERRLREHGLMTFDAQIQRVHAALHGDGAGAAAFAARLHETWPVMLVDEFQDTDTQQFAILDRIYRDDAGAARGRLVMIGDPKQAIYRFRGGDVHAYLAARAGADTLLHLQTNHRSSRALVGAFNEWYAIAGQVLGQDARIGVEPVSAAGRADATPLAEDGRPCPRPLVFHLQRECPSTRDERRLQALRACANHIAAMLESRRHTIGGMPLRPGDIAVLLPRHDDIVRLRALLLERRVPCVGTSRDSVFATPIARELLVFLYGIEHASSDAAVRAALATRLGGATFETLRGLHDDPLQWQPIAQRFMRWRARWHAGGVLAAIREVIAECGPRLVGNGDGERMLTDLRHLGELLQEASTRIEGVQGLLTWFAAQREAELEGTEAAEEQQLRIESDARRVRLMTLHASKGLEFPVVFLPLMWDHTGRALKWPVVPDPRSGGRVLDLGSEASEEAMQQACIEDQDERFRVLYVALTRARHACHVYLLPVDRRDGRSRSPLADPERSALDAMLARLQAQVPADGSLVDIAHHIGWSEGWDWPKTVYRVDAERRASRPRVLPEPPASRLHSKHSFSTLTRSTRFDLVEEAAAVDEAPAHAQPFEDAAVEDPAVAEAQATAEPHPELQALSAVRGADFGNALHAMFEHRRIGEPMQAQLDLVRTSLLGAGVRSRELSIDELVPRLAARVQATLEAPLLPETRPTLRLDALPAQAMRAEMEFHFAIDDVAMRTLRADCAALGEPDLVPMTGASRLHGLMTGKIDLVFEHEGRFHVLDYKGNHLGERLSDYSSAALRLAMDAHCYRFQALLYTVAVDRYLRQRLPGYRRSEHLGEAIYVFVRAAGLAPGAGVWAQRFDDALIEIVDRALGGDGGARQ